MATYKQSGVDIKLGDMCSKIMSEAADKTFGNRKGKIGEVKVLEKKGLHRVITISFGKYKLMLNSDGIGTKVDFAERMNKHNTIAYDLFAMLCDDSVRYGAEPVAISNVLDVNKLDKSVITALSIGMTNAAKDAGVAVVSGEIAELGERIGGYGNCNYNWGGTVLSFLKEEITGEKIKAGDCIIGLQEKGFRSNGISLVRKVMEKNYGKQWHKKIVDGKISGNCALVPSRIYTGAVSKMFNYVNGIAHITGGGIPGKFGRVLKKKRYGADIDNPFTPCWLMLHCQKIGNVRDREAYKVWNMGQGMLLVTDKPEKIMTIASEHKIKAKIVGEIIQKPVIKIKSNGYFNKGKNIIFSL